MTKTNEPMSEWPPPFLELTEADGQGRVLGGAILSSKEFKEDHLKPMLRHTGPSLSPFNAWVMLKGLETLKLRVEAQSAAALKIAASLEQETKIRQVFYPGLPSHPQSQLCASQMTAGGTLIAMEIAGGKQDAFNLMKKLKVIDISNNLGDTKSLITHPASTTHRAVEPEVRGEMGITDGILRLSVGLEDTDDLIEDLQQAINS